MKLGPVTKLGKGNKKRQKRLTMTSYQKIVTTLSFFRILANLEQSQSQILDREFAKFMFPLTVTFCLTKTENKTKKSLTQLSHCCFE